MGGSLWRSVNPFGPVFDRELRASARRKRTYLLRLAYLGFLLLFLWGSYQDMRAWMDQPNIGAVAKAQMLQSIGAQFLVTLVSFTMIAMMLTGPVLTSTAVGGERLGKTLPVLLASPLGAWSIVSGKLFSKVLTALWLIVLSFPALALVRLLGGVESADMIGGLATCAAVLVFAASVGLVLSVWIDRAYAVILLAFAVEFVCYGLVPMLVESLRATSPLARWAETELAPVHPIMIMIERLDPSSAAAYIDWWHSTWWPAILAHLGVSALLLLGSAAALRRAARRAEDRGARNAKPVDDSADAASAAKRRGWRDREANVADNAVLWREWRRPLMARRAHAVVALLAIGGLMGLVYHLADRSGAKPVEMQTMYAVGFTIMGVLLVTVLSATVIAQEKEGDTWTLLLATPVSPGQVVWGKVAGVLRKLVWPMAILCIHLAIFTAVGTLRLRAAGWVLGIIVSFSCLYLGTGVLFSLWSRRTTTAVVLNLLLLIGLWALLPMVAALTSRGSNASEFAVWIDPVYWVSEGVEPLCKVNPSPIRMPGLESNVPVEQFMRYGSVMGLISMAAGLAALWVAQSRFDRIVGRAASGGRAGEWRRRSRLGEAVG